jgi:hypothetical protein
MLLAVGIGDVGLIIAGKYQAAAAADAAALAAAPVTFRTFGAADGPVQEAARFAAMNGASVIACRCKTDRSWRRRTVEVVVERDLHLIGGREVTVQARSTAEFAPLALLDP